MVLYQEPELTDLEKRAIQDIQKIKEKRDAKLRREASRRMK